MDRNKKKQKNTKKANEIIMNGPDEGSMSGKLNKLTNRPQMWEVTTELLKVL